MGTPPIVVFAGEGSSHSWTWLADLFDNAGISEIRFLCSKEFVNAVRNNPRAVIISGGDGYSIASALSGSGFKNLTEYIDSGGLYFGICAGAYLPLRSSIEPFSQFNLSSVKIDNIDCVLTQLDNVPPRVAVRYGTCSIVHPVRGEVIHGCGSSQLAAPLYGGPIFREPEEAEVLMRYREFTENTEFQMPKRLARTIVLGKPSAVRVHHGDGTLVLLGPHLEHPRFRGANDMFLDLVKLDRRQPMPKAEAPAHPRVERAAADLKVAIVGLENRSFVVGKKLWDGSRFLELANAISKRSHTMADDLAAKVAADLETVRNRLTGLKMGIETDADETTGMLVEIARICVDNHFLMRTGSR